MKILQIKIFLSDYKFKMENEKKIKIPHPKIKKVKRKMFIKSQLPTSILEAINNSYEINSIKLKKTIG